MSEYARDEIISLVNQAEAHINLFDEIEEPTTSDYANLTGYLESVIKMIRGALENESDIADGY